MSSTAPSSPTSMYSTSQSPITSSRTTPPPSPQVKSFPATATNDHFTALPPEILLAIISHLPSSSSLLSLSQTNIYLQTFLLTTHAATICNTFITTRHAHAATILSAQYRDGWFLPTHEAVLGTERRIIRELVRKAGCGCVDCGTFLHSSRSTAASSSDLSLASDSSTQGCLNLPCFPTSPTRPSHFQKTCRAQHLMDSPWKLSIPGPMFLVFLERYEWEIETRHNMLQDESNEADLSKREDEERRFDFIVGNYSVRRFLSGVEREFGCEPTAAVETQRISKQSLGGRLRGGFRKGWAKSKRMFQVKKKKKISQKETQARRSTPPLFGEISTPESDTATVQKHDRSWMSGLLWYYGLQTPQSLIKCTPHPDHTSEHKANTLTQEHFPTETVTGILPRQSSTTESEPSEKRQAEKFRAKKSRSRMVGAKIGMEHFGGKLKQAFKRCKHVGGFQSLIG